MTYADGLYTYAFKLRRVRDGDTIIADWDFGGPDEGFWLRGVIFRLARIDAIEKKDAGGKEAKAALVAFLAGKTLTGRTTRLKETAMTGPRTRGDRWGRWILDLEADGIKVSDWLVAQGHAVLKEYD